MGVSFNGYKNNVVTFEKGNLTLGYPVSIDNDGKACNASSGEDFIGVCTAINGDYASVQTDGYVEMNYINTLNSYGILGFVAADKGKINPADPTIRAKTYVVVKNDKENKIVGFIL
jgi:hypothetical protein